jgi:hypothetical protein
LGPGVWFSIAAAAALSAGCVLTRSGPIVDFTPSLQLALPESTRALVADAAAFRLQVLVSTVEERRGQRARLIRQGFRVGAEYFYPASAIKLAAAVAALQTIERLGAEHQTAALVDTPFEIAPLFDGDRAQQHDPSNLAGGRMTVGHEIRKLALVSDNQAFNRLFDLVGQDELNGSMHRLGLRSTVITHRLSDPRTIPDPRASAEVTFFPAGTAPIVVPRRVGSMRVENRAPGWRIGWAFVQGGETIRQPMDFRRRNGMSLLDLQNLLVKVVRPDVDAGGPPLTLSLSHREMLVDALRRYPSESANPVYPAAEFPDHAVKFLLPGVRRVFPSTRPGERIEITGKIGQAYGFTIENSYLRNPVNGRAVFVAAVMYANVDGVLNDDRYDYSTVALPFMADLGALVAERWLR